MARIRNVFEIIDLYGHDENFEPHTTSDFIATNAPAGSRMKLDILARAASSVACRYGILTTRRIVLLPCWQQLEASDLFYFRHDSIAVRLANPLGDRSSDVEENFESLFERLRLSTFAVCRGVFDHDRFP